jgi:hypothetical protein
MLFFFFGELIFSSSLINTYGARSLVKNREELRYPKYMKAWDELKKEQEKELLGGGKEEAHEPHLKVVKVLEANFPHLSAEMKQKIIDLVITEGEEASDQEVATKAHEVLAPFSQGLATLYVNFAGAMFRLPRSVVEEIKATLPAPGT